MLFRLLTRELCADAVTRYYGAIIPSALNVFSMQGFLILNCIVGGQTLAAVSTHLNATLGIVIVSVISMLVSGPDL